MRKISALFIALCLSCNLFVYADTDVKVYDVNNVISDTAEYLIDVNKSPQYGSVGGEWLVIGLARGGCDVPAEYFEEYYKNLKEYVAENKGVLHTKKYTEYSRVVLALNSVGKNPKDVNGFDLTEPLHRYDEVLLQGINGPIFALIALNSDNRSYSEESENDAELCRMYLDYILEKQNDDGGFSLTPESASDVDITAMALQALSKYKENERCGKVIDKALNFLSVNQLASGGFMSYNGENSESCSQVVVALSSLGIGLEDSRFVKNGNSVLDALMKFRLPEQGFKHTIEFDKTNIMATEQALYAMVALERFYEGKTSLYDMTDVIKSDYKAEDAEEVFDVIGENIAFEDIVGSEYEAEILALAKRKIINGKANNVFDPYATMTRAEFATIAVKSISVPLEAADVFDDVRGGEWYYEYIATAYRAGIIKGVSEREFNPNGTITREQAAVMVARCAKMCGMSLPENEAEISNVLAQFDDYKTVSEWARDSLAFCYKLDILSCDDLNIEPQIMIERCEVVHMIYGLLKSLNRISE